VSSGLAGLVEMALEAAHARLVERDVDAETCRRLLDAIERAVVQLAAAQEHGRHDVDDYRRYLDELWAVLDRGDVAAASSIEPPKRTLATRG